MSDMPSDSVQRVVQGVVLAFVCDFVQGVVLALCVILSKGWCSNADVYLCSQCVVILITISNNESLTEKNHKTKKSKITPGLKPPHGNEYRDTLSSRCKK